MRNLRIFECLCCLLLFLYFMSGCSFTTKESTYYPNCNFQVQTENSWATLKIIPDQYLTTFRLKISMVHIPDWQATPGLYLLFSVPTSSIERKNTIHFKNILAWNVADPYHFGIGKVETGQITILDIQKEHVTVHIEAPELSDKFNGPHEFKVDSPEKSINSLEIRGFVNRS